MADARRKLGMTQAQLADRLGVSQPCVSQWETGRRTPSAPILDRIARLAVDEEVEPL